MTEFTDLKSYEEIKMEQIPVVYFDDEFIEDSMAFDSAGREMDYEC